MVSSTGQVPLLTRSFIQNEHPHGLPAGDTVIQVINYINHRDLTSGAETFNLGYPWNNE